MTSHATNASEAVKSKNAAAFSTNSYIKVVRLVLPLFFSLSFIIATLRLAPKSYLKIFVFYCDSFSHYKLDTFISSC